MIQYVVQSKIDRLFRINVVTDELIAERHECKSIREVHSECRAEHHSDIAVTMKVLQLISRPYNGGFVCEAVQRNHP